MPLVAVRVSPWVVVPVIVGAVLSLGLGGSAFATGAVAVEVADVEPPSLVAVTATRRVWPTSLGVSFA